MVRKPKSDDDAILSLFKPHWLNEVSLFNWIHRKQYLELDSIMY